MILTEEQKVQLRNLAPRGFTLRMLAETMGLKKFTVSEALRDLGLYPTFKKALSDVTLIREGLKLGYSAEKIMMQHAIDMRVIQDFLHSMNTGALVEDPFTNQNTAWSDEDKILFSYCDEVKGFETPLLVKIFKRNEKAIKTYRNNRNMSAVPCLYKANNPQHEAIVKRRQIDWLKYTAPEEIEHVAYDGPAEQKTDTTQKYISEGAVYLHPATEQLLVEGKIIPNEIEETVVYAATSSNMELVLASIKAAGFTPVVVV